MTRKANIVMPGTQIGRLFLFVASLALTASAQELTCPAVSPPPGNDFRGQTIVRGNFSYRDLTNADFSNATLIAPYFAYANLTNANFQGAAFVTDSTNSAMVSDFSFADLQKACFIGARFEGLAYFTNATLTCADFSKTDLSGHNVIFADGGPLIFDRARTDCRLAFRSAVMDCEFFNDWRFMDLGGADIKACVGQFAGRDFSGAKLNDVNLAGADLNGTKFFKANLNAAILNQASLIGADLSYATLLGAQLNKANLTNASLYYAFLSNDNTSGITNSASVKQSHLKNVNLSYAQLNGVDFTYSNFYGDHPTSTGICKTAPSLSQCEKSDSADGASNSGTYERFACGCASAHGARITKTNFKGAYLYGVDFTEALIQGGDFHEAVLTGANLNGATIRSDTLGNPTTFFRAFLQGTNLEGAHIVNQITLASAFVDFRPDGNNLFILLDGENHNEFVCPDCAPPTKSNVCVLVNYPNPTRVPASGAQFACPDHHSYGDCGPANPDGSNPKWKSDITDLASPPTGVPPTWYETDSTYIKAPANPRSVCNGGAPVIFW